MHFRLFVVFTVFQQTFDICFGLPDTIKIGKYPEKLSEVHTRRIPSLGSSTAVRCGRLCEHLCPPKTWDTIQPCILYPILAHLAIAPWYWFFRLYGFSRRLKSSITFFLKEKGLMILHVSFSGGLFHTAGDPQEVAFRQAVEKINADRLILPGLKLVPEIEIISPHDSFHASKRGNWAWICFLLVSLFNIYMWIGLFGNVIKRYPLKGEKVLSWVVSLIVEVFNESFKLICLLLSELSGLFARV